MQTYFCGLDNFGCIVSKDSNSKVAETPIRVDNIYLNICAGFDKIVYQKPEKEFSWYIQGGGIISESEIFSPDLQVSKVSFATNALYGLSLKLNSLYKAEFVLNIERQTISWTHKTVEKLDSVIVFKEMVTNDKTVYIMDDCSVIYEIKEGLVQLKWRLDGVKVTKLVCGFSHFVALSDTGALYSWGSGGRGELGHFENDNVMVDCKEPKRIEFFDDLPCFVKDICCGGWHTLALTSDGDVYSWGWNESGQLGHSSGKKLSSVGSVPFPVDLGSADDPITQIACGARHSIAVLKNGDIFSWGLNKHGELGLQDLENRTEPTKMYLTGGILNKPFKVECGRWCTFVYFLGDLL